MFKVWKGFCNKVKLGGRTNNLVQYAGTDNSWTESPWVYQSINKV